MPSAFEQNIIDKVESHGWFAISVAPAMDSDDPDEWFTYTIGLAKTYGWPEIIIFGLDGKTAHGVIADAIAECVDTERAPEPGLELTQTLKSRTALLTDASHLASVYFSSALWFAGYVKLPLPLKRVQLLWPDTNGRFPTDPECDAQVRKLQTPLNFSA